MSEVQLNANNYYQRYVLPQVKSKEAIDERFLLGNAPRFSDEKNEEAWRVGYEQSPSAEGFNGLA